MSGPRDSREEPDWLAQFRDGPSSRPVRSGPLVICGFGHVGQSVTRAIFRRWDKSSACVIERNEEKTAIARARGLRTVCGDAERPNIQRVAKVGTASEIIVCIDEPASTNIVQVARRLAPSAYIQVVVSETSDAANLREAGADRVIVVAALAGKLLANSIKRP